MNTKLNVLLVCGSGASSGFMAANMRKAAQRMGLEIDIKARSEAEIENYIDEIDVLMVGPHLAYILMEIEEYTHGENVAVILMKPEYYSTLNGEAAISHLQQVIAQKNKKEDGHHE
ncbi:PTS sugar transporter subunit IIB [Citrobacter koseri]|uniref:PTS sugar transporter subunit IIB n=1 Tax=Citrobacter koseri TaxID=545 RepID=UPI001C6323ED|nr:PTS sugar transporter subunit IIB [Citrobacter koseri]QYG86336.1 PTS sugar transporter subunit IIB [Citrobacter koseri]